MKTDLLRGTLDLLILQTLTLGPNHGLGISRRIQQVTRGAFDVKPGSLFPALHRLEEKGWLSSRWGESENKRKAKYYELTAAGRRQLRNETDNWARIAVAIARALKPT
jgi:PadR family transcriptional regulator, regulatory protein PadR